jgi:predicted RNA binding protein YcfA (HicA-like mRNA interferase family)
MKAVSGKDFCKLLRKRGWTLIGIHSSHHKYRHPDGRLAVVPVHGSTPLKVGLQLALMKLAGIDKSEL